MELDQGGGVGGHRLGTTSMVEWGAGEDIRIGSGEGAEGGSAREASPIHGNICGAGLEEREGGGGARTNAAVSGIWLVPVVPAEGMQLVDGVLEWDVIEGMALDGGGGSRSSV
jgi:hypothetical protein